MRSFRNIFSSMKIKHKVRVLFLFILAIYLIALFLIFAFVLRKQVYEYMLEHNQSVSVSIGSNLTTEIEKVNNFSRILLTNQAVNRYLTGDPDRNLSDYTNAVNGIYEVQNAYPEASSVFVFREDGNYLTVGRGVTFLARDVFSSDEWREEINRKDGGYVLRVNGDGAFKTNYDMEIVSLIRNINDVDTLKKKGILAVNFPLKVLEETYADSVSSERHFAYVDHKGAIICKDTGFDTSMEFEIGDADYCVLRGGFLDKTVYSLYHVPGTDFSLISYEKISLLKNVSREVIVAVIFLVILTIFSLLLIGAFISVYITTPIQKLVDAMSSVKEGWLRRVSIKHCDDEIGMLKDSYNEMLLETNNLIDQLLDKEKSVRKAEIDILQEQIKPHFLYNTIEMIASLSLDAGREEIYDALETLGSFYRQFLSSGSNEVTLKTEIEIIQNYLKIQKLRYGDIFEACYDVDESCLQVMLPKLILQPIVENSIYHGIRLKGERGIIRISVRREEESVLVEVLDTGVGMSEGRLKQVMADDSKGFGLRRTLERFRYYVGSQGDCHVESREGEYTKVILRIPENVIRKSEESRNGK